MARSVRIPLCASATLLIAAGACIATQDSAALPGVAQADSVVTDWITRGVAGGAVLLVSIDGEPVFHKAYGHSTSHEFQPAQYPDGSGVSQRPSRLSEPRPMTIHTAFDLASVTKVMATTFAVMTLVQDGALDLDTPVGTYLTDFQGGGKDRITARHLLTHRSGMAQWKPVYYHASDAEQAWEFVRDLPLQWEVDEGRHYSDLGFMTLGRLVEQISGTALPAFLTERLYDPLGLRQTGYLPAPEVDNFAQTSHGNPFEWRMVHDPDFGYRIEGDADAWNEWRRYPLIGEVNDGNAHHAFGGIAGHAGLFSTASDLNRLLSVLLAGGSYQEARFFDADLVDHFLTPTNDRQALGWQVPDYVPDSGFAHTGFTGTFVMGVRDTGLGVMLLTNRQSPGVDEDTNYPDLGPLQRAVVAALTGRPDAAAVH